MYVSFKCMIRERKKYKIYFDTFRKKLEKYFQFY